VPPRGGAHDERIYDMSDDAVAPSAASRATGAANQNLVLAAMVFAVAMTFIDQTIVAIAIPKVQKELSLSATGSQWVINGYLMSLSALFAFGAFRAV
jgi:hypothetical protein